MLGRVVDVAADGADVLAGRGLEDDLAGRDHGGRVREVDDAVRGEALQRLGRVGSEVDGRARGAEGADAVERLAGGGEVLVDDGEPVLVERHVGVGDVAVDQVEEAVGLDRDDAVALGVAARRNVGDPVGDLLRGGELEVRAVLEGGDGGVEGLDLVRLGLGGGADDLGLREGAEHAGVVGVLVGDQDLRDLLGPVAEVGERLQVGLDLRADVDRRVGRRGAEREVLRHAGVDEDHLAAGVDHPVLQAGAVFHRGVEPFRAFAAKGERASHEAVFGETDWDDLDGHLVGLRVSAGHRRDAHNPTRSPSPGQFTNGPKRESRVCIPAAPRAAIQRPPWRGARRSPHPATRGLAR